LAILLTITFAFAITGYLFSKPYVRTLKRNSIKQKPFTKAWRKIIQRRMPYFNQMPADLQLQLKQHIQIFISEKKFIGCNGINITDEIKVTIAAQACLLLLNKNTNYYPKLRTILVYPSAFIKKQQQLNVDGTHSIESIALTGESWGFGRIVLSWQDSLAGAAQPNDGHNLVIHEFAHQLDQENGVANGAPILGKDQDYKTWSDVFNRQFSLLQQQVSLGQVSLFDKYGATNPAEFFAVASEVFFEKAKQLSIQYPLLYRQMSAYYRVDPTNWQ
jgi:hypothetical protein